ncbi:hypothetical protein THIOSC15_3560006 [uncultured Thiomicrorhabdus sp.]
MSLKYVKKYLHCVRQNQSISNVEALGNGRDVAKIWLSTVACDINVMQMEKPPNLVVFSHLGTI